MGALAITFGLATLGLVLAYFKFLYRRRRPGEAPLVPGHFLFGNGKEFKTHAINFLQKTHKELGDVFTCRFLTQHWTFILDIHSYDDFNREKNFDFNEIQIQVNQNVFGFRLKDARKMISEASKKVNGKYLYESLGEFVRNLDDCFKVAIPQEEQLEKTITNVSQINTSGNESSTVAVNRFEADKPSAAELVNAQRLLSKAPKDSDFSDGWHEESLREMAAKVFFAPVFYTIFGRPEKGKENSFNPHTFHQQFDIFHKYFNFLFVALPVQLFPEAHAALKVLSTQPTAAEMAKRDGCSEYIKFSNQFMLDQGQTEVDVLSHNLVYLHVNYNTYRAIFWCMYKMMEDKEAMSALRKEIDEFVESKTSGGNIEDNEVVFTADELNKLPVIDAFVSEVFRWSSGVFMVRRCVKDTAFTTSKGETHIVRNGDRVAMYPPFFNYDEETFEKPKEFIYDRYLNKDFYKNGQKIKNPIIGYGSLCPGQKLAQLEIKWFIMNWANTFKYELMDGERTAPNTAHFGHEILPALSDVKCRFQYRENPIAFKYRNSYGDVGRGIEAL